MQLPQDLAEKVAAWLESAKISQLRTASQQLTQRYKTRQHPLFVQPLDQYLAYVSTRMPATYAVCRAVLSQLNFHPVIIKSLLDLGAGPGTASLAALEIFSQLVELTLVDKDPQFRCLALDLLSVRSQATRYITENITRFIPQASYDLVVCSYALNELNPKNIEEVVTNAWGATKHVLVLIEPGTPYGFSVVKQARQFLIDGGAYIVAPCTHHQACPLKENDWCHFSAYVNRSNYHRLAKNAELSYEHEKYSYIICARQPLKRPTCRVIKRPIQRPGHVIFDLCGESGVHRSTVSKKQKDRYTHARKLIWGAGWDEEDD